MMGLPPQLAIEEVQGLAEHYGLEVPLQWIGLGGVVLGATLLAELLECIQNDNSKDALTKEGQLLVVEYLIGLALPGS